MVKTRAKATTGEKLEQLADTEKIEAMPQDFPVESVPKKPKLDELEKKSAGIVKEVLKREGHSQQDVKKVIQQQDRDVDKGLEQTAGGTYEPSGEEEEAATMEEKKAEEEAADTEVPAGEAIAEGQERAEKAGGAKDIPVVEKEMEELPGGTAEGDSRLHGLHPGELAPDFSLKDEEGNTVSLKSLRGKFVALYFYNKDETPVINRAANAFASFYDEFLKMGVFTFFISPEPSSTHKNYKQKHNLPFSILSDPTREVVMAYGCQRGKGQVVRSTFIIDPEGKVVRGWTNVTDIEGHPKEVALFMKSKMKTMKGK